MTDGKPLTKSQLIARLADTLDVSKAQAAQALEALAGIAYAEAKNGFTIPGIGKLVLSDRKGRNGRNPATGEAIWIPPKKVVKFRIAKACKDAVLQA